jgi:hypothetical protein
MITDLILLLILVGIGLILYHDYHKTVGTVLLSDKKVTAAVKEAFQIVGLNTEAFDYRYDLQATGKTQEILNHASQILGVDHGLHTVGDVIDHLSKQVK